MIHLFVILLISLWSGADAGTTLKYKPAPVDNPLKGLVPYMSADALDRFPHSIEFRYFSIRDLMTGYDSFDWSEIEKAMEITQGRGCQITFRPVIEYPGWPNSVPQFLIDEGVKITKWDRAEETEGVCYTPDYEDPRLQRALRNFIEALGEKYDGDPRIAYLTAGVLGLWGEWHNYPRTKLMPSKETQTLVLDAFERAFKKTPILLRYPTGEESYLWAPNAGRSFGFHDDSFAWGTLATGKSEDSWFFMHMLKEARAEDAWKKTMIAGEVRPELWEASFTATPHAKSQGFDKCVKQTHVSCLMESGIFYQKYAFNEERKQRAIKSVQRMGYEFHISEWRREGDKISIDVENRGVAPFYQDWSAELFVGDEKTAQFDLRGILPGETKTWQAEVKGDGPFRLRVPNPMEGGKPLRFANEEQGAEWLVLP